MSSSKHTPVREHIGHLWQPNKDLSHWDEGAEKLEAVTNLTKVKMSLPIGSSSKPRLFALIIAINFYDNVRDLRGAVPDALSVKDYLENSLKVPSGQIHTLLNKSASRSAIIDALFSLRDDERIEKGDPIFIYYAGHGSELPAPESEGSRLQVLVPWDYCPTPEKYVGPIFDRTIGALIAEIAEKKGDNITIIFDCCHSASGTRGNRDGLPSVDVRSVELEPSIHDYDLDREIWDSGRRGSRTSPDLLHGGLSSHMLIAACSSSERAMEINGRGSFSSAFLKLLHSISPDELRYCDILTYMDAIPHQNPQCEGANQKRYLFNSRVSTHNRTAFKIALEQGQFILDAGVMAGITEGAEFVVHPSADSLFRDPLGILVVDKLGPFSTSLKVPPEGSNFVLSQPQAVALRTKMGQKFDLRLYVPDDNVSRLCREALLSLMDQERDFESIYFVDKPDGADFELAMENEKVIFLFRDQRVTQHGHTRLFEGVESIPEELADVLKAAAYFYWKLNRTNNNPIINSGVQVALYELLPPSIRRFNEEGDGLKPTGPNLYDTVMEVVADENIPYGFKLTNTTAYDLYANVFYFDLSDLSIVAYYETSSTAGKYTLDVPLPKNGGILTIGYGSGGAPAQTFYLRPGQNFDIGFLKIFLSTKPVDLSSIPQLSPFENTRSGDRLAKNEEEAWGTMLIPVLQRLSDPASLEVTQQTLQTQRLETENVALKREIDFLHEIETQRQEEEAKTLLALKTELQQEKAERQRLETLLQGRVEIAEPHAALDKRLENPPEPPQKGKTPVSGGWRLTKKFRWW